MALRDYARFFRADEDDGEERARETANEVISWVSCSYHAKFLSWLDEQAAKPIDISNNQLSVIESAVRANTLREVRAYLLKLRSKAAQAVGE